MERRHVLGLTGVFAAGFELGLDGNPQLGLAICLVARPPERRQVGVDGLRLVLAQSLGGGEPGAEEAGGVVERGQVGLVEPLEQAVGNALGQRPGGLGLGQVGQNRGGIGGDGQDAEGEPAGDGLGGGEKGVVEPGSQDLRAVGLALPGEQAGVAPFQLFEEGVGVGLAEQGTDLGEQAGRAAQAAVEPIDQVAGQLAPADPLVDDLVAPQELQVVMAGELGQGEVEHVGEVGRRALGQVAAGDDCPGALGQVPGQRLDEPGQVGIGDPAGFQVQGVLEVVEHQDELHLIEAIHGQLEPLARGDVAVGQEHVEVLATRPQERPVEGADQPAHGVPRCLGGRQPRFDLDRNHAIPDGLEPVGGAGGQRALAGTADAGDHGERRLALAQSGDQPLDLAATADVAAVQPLDAVAQQGVDGPGPA